MSKVHDEFSPVFIVGCERSGTTLLSVLLDRHSKLAVTPETHFFPRVYERYRSDSQLDSREKLVQAFFNERFCSELELDQEGLISRYKDHPADFAGLLRAALEEYAAQRNVSHVGEKTPGHLAYVDQIVQWYPHARVVGIVRDGRDVVRSLLKVGWTQKNLRLQSMVWRWAAREGIRLTKWFPNQYLQVRYEDLLRHPRETLTQIDQFIGIDFEEGQLSPQEKSGVVLSHESDYKGKATKELDPSRIGAWESQTNKHERWLMNSMMGRQLRQHGYDKTDLEGCPVWLRVWNPIANFLCRVSVWGPVRSLCNRCRKICGKG